MENIGYYNGKTGLIEEMTIPMNDRVTYFGDGVYDATYARNHKIFALSDHLDRFYNSCRLLKIPFDMPREELAKTLEDLVNQVDDGETFLYWQATRGTGMRNHAFPSTKPNLLVTVTPCKFKNVYKKLRLITLEDTRFFHCNVKTLNLIPSVLAAEATKQAGCDESVFYRVRGEQKIVTECAHSNVSMLKDGKFITAPLSNLILPGITRKHLIEICKELGIPVEEKEYTLEELFDADEIIVSSSGSLGIGAYEMDGKPVGGKDEALLKKIQDAYQERLAKATAI
ncbi:MAG: aminotransferase class IV [Candidatus Fimenecus sp.]